MATQSAQLSIAPREFTISARIVQGLIEAVESAGVPRAQLLRAARIEPHQLQQTNFRLLSSEVHRLCDLAIDLTHDPALGLHWAERLSSDTFNPISHMLVHSPTLRHAFEALSHCCRLLTDKASYVLLETQDAIVLRCTPPPSATVRTRKFTAEMLLASFLRLIRSFSPRARPLHVHFDYPAPGHRADYARVFQGAERFGQAHSELAFARELLDIVPPYKDDDVHRALRIIAERRVLLLADRIPYSLRARDYLVQHAPAGRADMMTVARALGLSERSLRRRIDAEGKTFHEVVNEAQAILATHLMGNTRLTIQEITFELGFADASAFHRAFKRWTGETPVAYRARLRASRP